MFFDFSGYDSSVPRTMFDMFGAFNEAVEQLIADYDGE